MSTKLPVKLLHPEDLHALWDKDELRRRVLYALTEVAHGDQGITLEPRAEHQVFPADLTAWRCKHVRGAIGDTTTGDYRIIFREQEGTIEVLAIGPRNRSLVYLSAGKRLQRMRKTRRPMRVWKRRGT